MSTKWAEFRADLHTIGKSLKDPIFRVGAAAFLAFTALVILVLSIILHYLHLPSIFALPLGLWISGKPGEALGLKVCIWLDEHQERHRH